MFDIVVIGGGVSGSLAAFQCSTYHPDKRIALFERRKQLLADHDQGEELQLGDRNWSREQLLNALMVSHVKIYRSSAVESIHAAGNPDLSDVTYEIITRRAEYKAHHVIIACGRDLAMLKMLSDRGLKTCLFQPAAFHLRCDDTRLKAIKAKDLSVVISWHRSGVRRKQILIQLASTLPEAPPLKEVEGKISIHSGMVSGAAINELTSYIARQSDPVPERLKICINWLPEYRFQGILEYIQFVMNSAPEKTVFRTRLFNFPSKLWIRLVTAADIGQANRWKDLSPIQLQELASQLVDSHFVMRPDLRAVNISKYYGGVHLENIHPDRPECIRLPKVYLVGDILDKVSEDSTRNQAGITDHGLAWIRHIG